MTALSTCQRCTCRYYAAYQKTAASAWFFSQRACCLPKANQRMQARLRTRAETEEVSRFSAVKKQIDGCQRAFGFWHPLDGSVQVLFSCLGPAVTSLFSPSPKGGGCAAFSSGCTRKRRGIRCILQERLRLLNQALTMELRGRGRGDNYRQAGSLGVGMVGAREGQKTGRVGKNAGSHQCGRWREE